MDDRRWPNNPTAEVHHLSAATGDQVRPGRQQHVQRAREVDRQRGDRIVIYNFGKRVGAGDAGVVHDDVEIAEAVQRCSHDRTAALSGGDAVRVRHSLTARCGYLIDHLLCSAGKPV